MDMLNVEAASITSLSIAQAKVILFLWPSFHQLRLHCVSTAVLQSSCTGVLFLVNLM